MATKDYRYIGNMLRERFTKEHPSNPDVTEYLPSILAISADIIDLHYKNKKMQCRMELLNCTVHEECEEGLDCVCKKRIFYVYINEHCFILDKPERLDDKLIIDNHYHKGKGNLLFEVCKEGVYELAYRVLYHYYEVIPWNKCYWHIDYYEEILGSIFLFCPDILCYAMKKEMDDVSKTDKHVQLAIQKCLDFSIRVDAKMEEEKKARNKKERQEFYEQIIVDINGFHVLRNAEVALTGELNQKHEIGDVVKKIMRVGGNVVLEARRLSKEWAKQKDTKKFEKEFKELIGANNYNYIYKYNDCVRYI